MNFQGFKKTGSDSKTTTFEHPNGSKLMVAHAALDPKTLKKISALPVHKACGGQIQKFAGEPDDPTASQVQPVENLTPDQADMKQQLDNRIGQIKDVGTSVKNFLFGRPEDNAYFNPQQPSDAQTSAAAPDQSASAQGPAPTNVTLPQTQTQTQAPGLPMAQNDNFKYDPYSGVKMSMEGNTNEANTVGDIEDAKAQAFQKYSQDLQNINYQTNQNAWNNKVETDNAIADMKNGHIDPKAYVNNMTGGEKTATAIGLLLGGLGGALTHTANPALEFLNKQIAHDVEAQRANMDNKKTIFNAMQQQYGNQQDALKMTHAFYLAKMQNDINEAAAKNGGALALARAQQLNGPLQQQLQQIHWDVGMRQSAFKALQNGADASAALPYLVQDKSKVEDAAKAYGAARALNEQQKNALQSFDDIRNKTMNGMFSPNDTASAKQAFIGTLQVALEHRYNSDAAAALGNAIFPSKTDISDQTLDNKRKRLVEEFNAARAEHDSTLRALTGGIVGAPQPPATSAFKKRK